MRPFFLALVLLTACATKAPEAAPQPAPRGLVRPGTPPSVDIARARARGGEQGFTWAPWAPETFARARAEGRFILLDGAAEWCHWCHVMDETTYRDPEVGRVLRERFVAIRVDVDARPDIAERYAEWGWPATILLSPDAQEIGKYRGYLPPEELKEILHRVVSASPEEERSAPTGADRGAPVEAFDWIAELAAARLDAAYDREEGSWGRDQKVPLGKDLAFEIARAARGDAAARARALFTIEKQRALIDPVWGGIYQYSAGSTWSDPHYEKLMEFQADNLAAYARGFALSRDPRLLADARAIERYMNTFLSNAEGAFLVSQDADVNAHDASARFVDGHVYYRLGDEERRRLGVPRVDDHVYGRENGMAVAALVALHDATQDAAVLARARRAADVVIRLLVTDEGEVRRGERPVRYLADAAAMAWALALLSRASGEASYRDMAARVVKIMERDLFDASSGAFFAHTPDPAAQGVFARPERPFEPNLLAARAYAALALATGDDTYRARGRRALVAIATPREMSFRARTLGGYLLAADELGKAP